MQSASAFSVRSSSRSVLLSFVAFSSLLRFLLFYCCFHISLGLMYPVSYSCILRFIDFLLSSCSFFLPSCYFYILSPFSSSIYFILVLVWHLFLFSPFFLCNYLDVICISSHSLFLSLPALVLIQVLLVFISLFCIFQVISFHFHTLLFPPWFGFVNLF